MRTCERTKCTFSTDRKSNCISIGLRPGTIIITRKGNLKKGKSLSLVDKKSRLSSNDSHHHLKILSKSAGQPRRQHKHGAKNRATAVLWACLAQFLFLFALDNPHSVKVNLNFDKI